MLTCQEKQLRKAWTEAYSLPPDIPMWQWAEKYLTIPRRSGTPFAGKYKTSITPWVKEWFDSFQNPEYHTVVIEKGAQVGATQTCYCAICYWVCEDPDPILVVMPAADDAKESSRVRIQPIIEDSPRVANERTGDLDDMQLLNYRLKNTVVRLVGSNSPGKLASFAHRFLILDETDKYKENLGKEGSVVGLATQRTKQFWNRKRIALSTPTTEAGYIHRLYLRGDQRKFFVPCPHCGHFQVLVFTQVKFDSSLPPDEAGDTAYYECEKCKKEIQDRHKSAMVKKGEWRSTATASRKGYVSYHLSGLYSNSDECSFGSMTSTFLTVKDNPADLQDFINSDLGEIWEERPIESFSMMQVYKIRDRNIYERGTIPTDDPCYLGLIVDVQAHYLVWAIWAFRPHDLWLIDHGTASTFADLDDIKNGPYKDEKGNHYSCHIEVLDSGYRTTDVYKYCMNRPNAIPFKGDTGATTKQTQPVRFQRIDRMPDGRMIKMGRGLVLRHVHPSYFKDELYTILSGSFDEDGEIVKSEALPLRIHFHNEVDRDYASQLTGEVPMESKPDKFGNQTRYWKRVRANHQFDCAQYAMALRWMMRNDLSRLDSKSVVETKPEPKKEEKPKPVVKKRGKASYDKFDDWED